MGISSVGISPCVVEESELSEALEGRRRRRKVKYQEVVISQTLPKSIMRRRGSLHILLGSVTCVRLRRLFMMGEDTGINKLTF